MSWFFNIFTRAKASDAPTVRAEPGSEERMGASPAGRAVELFAQCAAKGNARSEQVWLKEFVRGMQGIEQSCATRAWLEAVDRQEFCLDATDKGIQGARLALVVDSNKPKIVNVRTLWADFVVVAVVDNEWDMSLWAQRTRWFKIILDYGWKPDTGKRVTSTDKREKALAYVQRTARQHAWARDLLLEYLVLNPSTAQTMQAMFEGHPSSSLHFVTALAGIALRMQHPSPAPLAVQWHQQAHAAWPEEMTQIEATMQVQAMMEGTTLETTARIAASMEIGNNGYSAFLPFFGESIHAVIQHCVSMRTETVALPALD